MTTIVRAQELGGRWVSIGGDAARGIVAQDLTADADSWGSRSLAATLRRKPDVPWLDLSAFTPLEYEKQCLKVWSGRINGTPTSDGADRKISISGEGWQYHLDDDVFRRAYLRTKLGDFTNVRDSLSADLSKFTTAGQVQVGDSAIVLGFNAGDTIAAGVLVGATLDFGPSLCRVVTFNWESSNNAAPFSIFCDGHDNPDGAQSGSVETAITFAMNSGASGGSGPQTFVNGHRYVSFLLSSGGGGGPLAADVWFRVNLCATFSDPAYEAANISVLRADQIVTDAIDRGTLLLSSDRSGVEQPIFYIPEFAMDQPSTPRETWVAANAFHDWQSMIDVELAPVFRPLATDPTIQVDARSNFEEASAGDASEIYSTVDVTFTDPAGQPQLIARGQVGELYEQSLIQPTNPSADVNAADWFVYATGTVLRTTTAGEFTTAPGGFKLAVGTGNAFSAYSDSWTGSFIPGQTYRLTFDLRINTADVSAGAAWIQMGGYIAGGYLNAVATSSLIADDTFHQIVLEWVQPDTTDLPVIVIYPNARSAPTMYWDNLVLYESVPTIVNRRHFRRTKVLDTSMALTTAGAQQIGDIFLEAHKRTPFKGVLTVTGYGTARRTPSGAGMPACELLRSVGEIIRFAHLIDPDTGAVGREGRVASVSYDEASDTATVSIDSETQDFQAVLSRMAIVTGQVRS